MSAPTAPTVKSTQSIPSTNNEKVKAATSRSSKIELKPFKSPWTKQPIPLEGSTRRMYIRTHFNGIPNYEKAFGMTASVFRKSYPDLASWTRTVMEEGETKVIYNAEAFDNTYLVLPTKGLILDQTKDIDRFWISQLHREELIAPNQVSKTNKSVYYILDVEADAEVVVARADKVRKCFEVLESLSPTEQREYGVLFGADPINNSTTAVKARIYQEILEKPDSAYKWFNSPTESRHEIDFNLAIIYGIIKLTQGYYKWSDIVLGVNRDEAKRWFISPENSNSRMRIKQMIEENQKVAS